MPRQATAKKQQISGTKNKEPIMQRRRTAKVLEETPFVPFLKVDIKTGECLVDNRLEKYWKV